jgi:hypothetical protein
MNLCLVRRTHASIRPDIGVTFGVHPNPYGVRSTREFNFLQPNKALMFDSVPANMAVVLGYDLPVNE